MNHYLITFLSDLYHRAQSGTIEDLSYHYETLEGLMKMQSRWGKDRGAAQRLLKALFNLSHLAVRHEGCRNVMLEEWAKSNRIVASWKSQADLNAINFVEERIAGEKING